MADRPAARDEDRLPWLEQFGEGERSRKRKPASGTALVALLIAFFGVGLAVAFSLGTRFARSPAGAPAASVPKQPERTASVEVSLAPPVPLPKVELVAPPAVAEAPAATAPEPVAARPATQRARPTKAKGKAKAKKRYKRKPVLRPFVNIKKRPATAPAPQPFRWQASALVPVGPKGRMVQLGSYSTKGQADQAWRSIVWRYPYLRTKPRVVVPTPPVGGYRYYRLRLGTETQAQSLVICQHLRARGQSCIVIY